MALAGLSFTRDFSETPSVNAIGLAWSLPALEGGLSVMSKKSSRRVVAGVSSAALVAGMIAMSAPVANAIPSNVDLGINCQNNTFDTTLNISQTLTLTSFDNGGWRCYGLTTVTGPGSVSFNPSVASALATNTPTVLSFAAAGTYQLLFDDGEGDSGTVNVTVVGPTLSPATQSLSGNALSAITPTSAITASDFVGTPTFTASNLPAGLTINADTGVISGTPTGSGSGTITVTGTASEEVATAMVTFNIGARVGVPTAPSMTNVTTVPNIIYVDFTAPDSDGGHTITGYEVSVDGGATWNTALNADETPVTSDAEQVVVFSPGLGSHAVTLRAVNSVGAGAEAQPVTVDVIGIPWPPTIQSLTPNGPARSVAATWAAPANDGGAPITAYLWEVRIANTVVQSGVVPGNVTSLTVSNLNPGQAYWFVVGARNENDTTGDSTAQAFSMPTIAPSAPQNLDATNPEPGVASVGFTAPSSNGGTAITGYKYSIDGGSNWVAAVDSSGNPVTSAAQRVYIRDLNGGTDYSILLVAVNARGNGTASDPVNVTVAPIPVPAITPEGQSVTGTAGTTIDPTVAFNAVDFSGPVTYTSTTLPAGLELNASTGVISGTPTESGSTQVTVTGTAGQQTASATVSFTIAAAPVPAITPESQTVNGTTGTAIDPTVAFNAVDFSGPVTFTSTALPAGLELNASTGVVTGTPTIAGATNVTVTASDGERTASSSIAFTIVAAPVPAISPEAQTVNGTVGTAIDPTVAFNAVDFSGPVTYTSTALPAGLELNADTGVISGTPSASSTTQVTVTATSGQATATATVTFVIASVPTPTPPAPSPNNNETAVTPTVTSTPTLPPLAPTTSNNGSQIAAMLQSPSVTSVAFINGVLTPSESNIIPGGFGVSIGGISFQASGAPGGVSRQGGQIVMFSPRSTARALVAPAIQGRSAVSVAEQIVNVSGSGYAPNSQVKVYLLPDFLIGTVTTDASGSFTSALTVPAGLPLGDGVIQAVGYTSSNEVLTISGKALVVTVDAKNIVTVKWAFTGKGALKIVGGYANINGMSSHTPYFTIVTRNAKSVTPAMVKAAKVSAAKNGGVYGGIVIGKKWGSPRLVAAYAK